MKTIWKYEIEISNSFTVRMPLFAEFLHIDVQDERPCMWFLVDDKFELVDCEFCVIGTGHNAEGMAKNDHLGTFQLQGGRLVFHVFSGRTDIPKGNGQ